MNDKTVVITGASSGIGKACALYLDQWGFNIYAGVRKQSDGDELQKNASKNLKTIILDVTDLVSIRNAADSIGKETGGNIFGLINNAGIGRGGALEVTPMEEIRNLFEVNVIGLLAVTRAFIPILRSSQGRIVNIGSTSSFLAVPGASVYSGSKFAVRAITDSLRVELKSFGMSVILVAPGAVESAIWEKGKKYKEGLRKTVKPELAELYAPLKKFGDRMNTKIKKIPAVEVAKVVANILSIKKPKACYWVGNDARAAARAARLPKAFLDWIIIKRIQKL
jgi:short-subunit dehydrogenase